VAKVTGELPQAAHVANVLFFVTAMDHRPARQEEQRFEKRVRDEMDIPTATPPTPRPPS
jgi:hypothetical protein